MNDSKMDKTKVKNEQPKMQPIPCALHGFSACPKPHECDGLDRLCTFWNICSGR